MADLEQSIKVSARGEFGQLQQGLKNLQKDLSNVTSEIDKGARKGGFFDDSQIQALDLFRKRFLSAFAEIEKELDNQNNAIDKLHEKLNTSSKAEQQNIKNEIAQREKKLDVIRKELEYAEKLYSTRNNESSSYRTGSRGGGSNGGSPIDTQGVNAYGQKSKLGMVGSTILGKGLGLAKGGLALAGIGGIGGILSSAYQQAYSREVGSLDLAQRLRSGSYSGTNTDIYDQVSEIGRRSGMGYSQMESWQMQNAYTQRGGLMAPNDQYNLQMFSRGYGLDSSTVGSMMGGMKAQGGFNSPKEFASEIAGSVQASGMTPRILEVMQTSANLLASINTNLKDGGAKQVLSYQTALDQVGTSKGMTQLTGANGASYLQGLAGIFQPGNDQWEWMGIRALQKYNPKKYGNKDLFNLQSSYEDGLSNPDNLPAMASYIKSISHGNKELSVRTLQKWFQSGGKNVTLGQASQFWDGTNGLSTFDPDNMAKINSALDKGSDTSKYTGERQGEKGQGILDINAQYDKALEGLGSQFLGIVTDLKKNVTEIFKQLDDGLSYFTSAFDSWFDNFIKNLPQPWQDKLKQGEDFITNNLGPLGVGAGVIGAGWKFLKSGKGGSGGGGSNGDGTEEGVTEEPTSEPTTTPEEAPSIGDTVDTAVEDASKVADSSGILGNLGKIGNKFLGPLSAPFLIKDAWDFSKRTGQQVTDFQKQLADKQANPQNYSHGTGNIMSDLGNGLGSLIRSGVSSIADFFGGTKASAAGTDEAEQLSYTGNASITNLPYDPATDNSSIENLPYKVDDMVTTGKDKFQALSDGGLKTFDKFEKGNSDLLSKFTKGGSDDFSGMSDSTTKSMNAIVDAHKSLVSKLENIFSSLIKSVLAVNPTGGVSSGPVPLPTEFSGMLKNVISRNEGDYSTVVPNDNGALSIGEFQWHGNRARDLLKAIRDKDSSAFNGKGITDSLDGDWSSKTVNKQESKEISDILQTTVGEQTQDIFANQDMKEMVDKAKSLGITDPKAVAYFADMYNQSPRSASQIAKQSDGSLDSLYQISMKNSVLNPYVSRRNGTYNDLKDWTGTGTDTPSVNAPIPDITPTTTTASSNGINVSVNITGDGASQLNQASASQLHAMMTKIAQQVLQQAQQQKLAVNPTANGY